MIESRFGFRLRRRAVCSALALSALGALFCPRPSAADILGGPVYTSSNAESGNELWVLHRSSAGQLFPVHRVATGGLGTGSGLGNQGALALSEHGRWLFVVNAGSDELSVFSLRGPRPILVEKVASGGATPISVTVHNRWLYVLNAGGNIAGFAIGRTGLLSPIPGSRQPLTDASAGPAQISFSPDGRALLVTEKNTNNILVFPLHGGVAQAPLVHESHGETPFGFAFDSRGHLIVSEAFGGVPDASALSSYALDGSELRLLSGSVPTGQTAACWVAISRSGRFAYTTNTGSGSISGYRVSREGALQLLTAGGRTAVTGVGSAPTDVTVSGDGRFVLSLNPGNGTLTAFKLAINGSLQPASWIEGLPGSASGLLAQ